MSVMAGIGYGAVMSKALFDGIENKIANFSGQAITYGVLAGRNENLLPMTDEIKASGMGNRYPDSWYQSWAVEEKLNSLISRIAPPLPEFYVAKRRVFNRKKPKLLDIYEIGRNFMVSTKVRDLIQDFDPGVHQFSPVELVNKSGEVISDDYHFMQVLRYLDFGNLEDSVVNENDISINLPTPTPMNTFMPPYWQKILATPEIREFLLAKPCWVVKYLETDSKHLSGSLVSMLLKEKCTGLKPYTDMDFVSKGEVLYYV